MPGLKQGWLYFGLCLLTTFNFSCRKTPSTAQTAFYYWKSTFQLNGAQNQLLRLTAGNRLYLHFFDIAWDDLTQKAYPDAIIRFRQPVKGLSLTPVIFIRNSIFQHLSDTGADSLARNTFNLLTKLSIAQQISYKTIQFDCDWTTGTRDRYFRFLKTFKVIDGHPLQATIRLHQVKYQLRTGVPPVSRGVLMFYNMGKVTADVNGANSIYNPGDAGNYINYLDKYPIPLDVALPAFSWSVHSRNGKVTGLPVSIGRNVLEDPQRFAPLGKAFKAKKSFFFAGIYIKQNDIFKPEEADAELLKEAARQLADHLAPQPNRKIIYYELANLDLAILKAEDLERATARF